MSLPQQDPYQTLGITNDADLSAVKSAYRKLVLKCHPDKFQDAAMKAVKQDEFQKVQQAYELLSDETQRTHYDEQVKLYELRKEMGRGGPPPGKGTFDYEVRTAEPRSSSFRSSPKETQRPYTQSSPWAYGEEVRPSSFEEPSRRARRTTSYEDRRRPATRDGEKSRRSEEERERERWEKELKRSAHGAAKKYRDKERKKGTEEKFSRTTYVEDDDSEDAYQPRPERKSSRGEEDVRARERLARAAEKLLRKEAGILTDRTKKLDIHRDFAVSYMQAARRKAEPETDFRPKPLRRAEAFHEPAGYKLRHATPPSPYVEDDDLPRRSSATRTMPRRGSDQSRSFGKERNASMYDSAYIVEASPPSPPDPPMRKPPLKSYNSEPPVIPMMTPSRKDRSKTMQAEYTTRREPTTAPPPLPRASTFQAGDKIKSSTRSSKLTQAHYPSEDSESDDYSPRRTSPRRREQPETTRRYVIEKGRSVPLDRHRETLREHDYNFPRERSESPRDARRSTERPRASGPGSHQSYSRGQYFSRSHSPEPIIKDARPKMSARDSSGSSGRGYFPEVKFAPHIRPENVSYSSPYRRGSDPTHHSDFVYPLRPARETAYT